MTTPSRSGPSRRQVLAGGTAVTAAAMSGGLRHIVEKAYAAEPTKHASVKDIEHVVFLMMENRSFDHYFGTYPGVRGFGDKRALDGVFKQRGYRPGHGPDKHGHLPPFHLNTRNLKSWSECVDDITHNWGPQHRSRNDGHMNHWLHEHLAHDGNKIGPLTMGYYERKDIPLYHALADAFTICDAYFCSVLGPTDPNRVMSFSATIDPSGEHGGPILETLVTNRASQYGKLTWKTMPEHLEEAGVSWKTYMDPSAELLLNPLPYFKAFSDDSNYLGQNAAGAFSYPAAFEADVAAGTLPSVSWVFPPFAACDHPSAPPIYGEQFVAGVLNTLVSNRAVWEKTAFIVMYDENGGFFDHVPPPVAPHGTHGEYLTMDKLPSSAAGLRGPVGLGFRVPALVISPYSRGGFVCSDVLDHTSQLKFIEKRFGVDVPNLSHWRRKTVGDMTKAFSFGRARHSGVPDLPTVDTSTTHNKIIVAECVAKGQGGAGVFDKGVPTPVPHHVPAPKQPHKKPRRPVH
jgi:phospholipase C